MTDPKSPRSWVQPGQGLIGVLAVLGFLYILAQSWMQPPSPEAAASLKPKASSHVCEPGLPGLAGRSTDLSTPAGLKYSVVAPSNYLPEQPYGLLMMYPPAGFSNDMAERYYQLTRQANEAGYVVAFSAAIPLSGRALRLQSEVVPQIMSQWCIDPERVVLAGHSDGGSLSTGLTVRQFEKAVKPARIVVSAAGITLEDLQQEVCPAPLHVSVLHNPKDDLFPGFGEGAAKWWGQCMQCEDAVQTEATGCQVRQCAAGKTLRYCATTEQHVRFPAVASHLFEWVQ